MSKFSPFSQSNSNPRATSSTKCQKCLQMGHFTYQCKKSRPYVSRPSRTQLLDNPKLREKEKERRKTILSEDLPEEFRNKTGVADALLTARESTRSSGSQQIEPSNKILRRESSPSGSSSGSYSTSESEAEDSHSRSDVSKQRIDLERDAGLEGVEQGISPDKRRRSHS